MTKGYRPSTKLKTWIAQEVKKYVLTNPDEFPRDEKLIEEMKKFANNGK